MNGSGREAGADCKKMRKELAVLRFALEEEARR